MPTTISTNKKSLNVYELIDFVRETKVEGIQYIAVQPSHINLVIEYGTVIFRSSDEEEYLITFLSQKDWEDKITMTGKTSRGGRNEFFRVDGEFAQLTIA